MTVPINYCKCISLHQHIVILLKVSTRCVQFTATDSLASSSRHVEAFAAVSRCRAGSQPP